MTLDQKEIKKILPHRDPMLLVDRVTAMDEETITAEFYVSPDREIFRGHFPGSPVFPGVYTIEVLAQTCDILILTRPCYAGKEPLFMGVDRARFLRRIFPGDTLAIRARIDSERPDQGIVKCCGEISVGETEVFRGEVTLAMR